MIQAEKNWYLQAMGITPWRQRTAQHQDLAITLYGVAIDSVAAAPRGLLLTDAVDQLQPTAPAHYLLTQIGHALGVPNDLGAITGEALPALLSQATFIILLGRSAANAVAAHVELSAMQAVVITHDLTTLLQDPPLKAELWQTIKHYSAK